MRIGPINRQLWLPSPWLCASTLQLMPPRNSSIQSNTHESFILNSQFYGYNLAMDACQSILLTTLLKTFWTFQDFIIYWDACRYPKPNFLSETEHPIWPYILHSINMQRHAHSSLELTPVELIRNSIDRSCSCPTIVRFRYQDPEGSFRRHTQTTSQVDVHAKALI